jgi:hypothetical protein
MTSVIRSRCEHHDMPYTAIKGSEKITKVYRIKPLNVGAVADWASKNEGVVTAVPCAEVV